MKRYASTTLQTAAAGRVRRPKRRYRAIWISDVHLGTKGCKAATLCDFLGATESTTLYLVGDIIDGWQLRKRWFWTAAQARVVRHILDKARSGTRVIYVPGNHDAHLRGFEGMQLADVVVVDEAVHVTADGRRLLVLHGDEFDAAVKHHAWLAHLGDGAYQLSLRANDALNAIRTRLGFPYWSLSGYLKERVKDAVSYVQDFEEAVAAFARGRGFDGVVCGSRAAPRSPSTPMGGSRSSRGAGTRRWSRSARNACRSPWWADRSTRRGIGAPWVLRPADSSIILEIWKRRPPSGPWPPWPRRPACACSASSWRRGPRGCPPATSRASSTCRPRRSPST
jgi:UDP-2,3-diacylglucosamine pyrophosphatase LpxH